MCSDIIEDLFLIVRSRNDLFLANNARAPFIRELAARVEGGLYQNAVFGLALSMRQRRAFEAELATAGAAGGSPWQIPDELISHEALRPHEPRYAVSDGRAHFEYSFWRRHLAPKR